jgi:hypothetical protein
MLGQDPSGKTRRARPPKPFFERKQLHGVRDRILRDLCCSSHRGFPQERNLRKARWITEWLNDLIVNSPGGDVERRIARKEARRH